MAVLGGVGAPPLLRLLQSVHSPRSAQRSSSPYTRSLEAPPPRVATCHVGDWVASHGHTESPWGMDVPPCPSAHHLTSRCVVRHAPWSQEGVARGCHDAQCGRVPRVTVELMRLVARHVPRARMRRCRVCIAKQGWSFVRLAPPCARFLRPYGRPVPFTSPLRKCQAVTQTGCCAQLHHCVAPGSTYTGDVYQRVP